jgi:hypothetical protein
MKKSTLYLSSTFLCAFIALNTYASVGPYVGVDMGIGSLNSNLNDSGIANYHGSQSSVRKNGGLSLGAHVGYTFLSHKRFQLGVEGGYQVNPENTLSRMALGVNPITEKLAYDSHYVDLLAVAQFKLSHRWGLVAKYGSAHVSQSTSFDGGEYTFQDDRFLAGTNSGYLPEVAVGTTYQLNNDDKLTLLAKAVVSNRGPMAFPNPDATKEGINRLASSGMIGASYDRIF